ncbi:MAG: immunoglobulin domain-containing protein [Verrucomicrobiales bacterium]
MKFSKYLKIAAAAGLVSSALHTQAQTVVNPSFEDDTFDVWPGYVSGNFPITGWTSAGGAGINPAGGSSPFGNNGAVPDGAKVAFIQEDSFLSQLVSGFVPEDDYYITFFENARGGNRPGLSVLVGGETVIPEHIVTSVGGTNAYREVRTPVFKASAADLEISFQKSNPFGGDNTVLIDNVRVTHIPAGTAPTVSQHPVNATAMIGGNLVLTAGAFGSLPLEYQWLFNGQPIEGATSQTLELNELTSAQSGKYSLRVTNPSGTQTSNEATVSVLDRIDTLFMTGVDDQGIGLADGETDPHYQLIANADNSGSAPIVQNSLATPIVAGPWLANTETSKWIGPQFDTVASAVGDYVYQATFDLTGYDYTTANITGGWATDNTGRDILINGQSTGQRNAAGFASLTPFSVTTGFVPGVNTLTFIVTNEVAVGYTGLRVDNLLAGARALPANTPITILTQPQAQTARETGNVTFRVGAQGSGPVTYQWTFNGADIPGATSASYTVAGIAPTHAGKYGVKVTNAQGTVTSQAVDLTVGPAVEVSSARYAGIWIDGIIGRRYAIEFTQDLGTTWSPLRQVTITTNPEFIVDQNSAASTKRFYRSVLIP